jgi:hypothetical protein
MLRRKRNILTSGNCTLRDGIEAMGVSAGAKRWSGYAPLEGEQLDEWQLHVEERERSYGTFAGRKRWSVCCIGEEQLDEWQLCVEGREKKLWYVCWRRDV